MLATLITLVGLFATALALPNPFPSSLVTVKLFPNGSCTGNSRVLFLGADQCHPLGGAQGLEVVSHADSLKYNACKSHTCLYIKMFER